MGEARKRRRGENEGEREGKEGEERRNKKREGEDGCYTCTSILGGLLDTHQVVLCPGTMNSGRCIIGVLVKESGEVLSSS